MANSTINCSINRDKVTKYTVSNGQNSAVISQTYNNPLEGYPYFSIYAYKWAGLDNTGTPQLLFNEAPTKTYTSVSGSKDRSNITQIGSSVPTTYGNLLNSFSYKSLSLSFNITYRLGYYFRRTSLNNGTIYSGNGFTNSIDYNQRWQKPGDELTTNVPALVYPNVNQRTDAYTFSNLLVEKADNIKLQDVRVSWNLSGIKAIGDKLKTLQLYATAYNLGYLWKANDHDIDPDAPGNNLNNTTARRTITFGVKADL